MCISEICKEKRKNSFRSILVSAGCDQIVQKTTTLGENIVGLQCIHLSSQRQVHIWEFRGAKKPQRCGGKRWIWSGDKWACTVWCKSREWCRSIVKGVWLSCGRIFAGKGLVHVEGRVNANQHRVLLADHLYPMMKNVLPVHMHIKKRPDNKQ